MLKHKYKVNTVFFSPCGFLLKIVAVSDCYYRYTEKYGKRKTYSRITSICDIEYFDSLLETLELKICTKAGLVLYGR